MSQGKDRSKDRSYLTAQVHNQVRSWCVQWMKSNKPALYEEMLDAAYRERGVERTNAPRQWKAE